MMTGNDGEAWKQVVHVTYLSDSGGNDVLITKHPVNRQVDKLGRQACNKCVIILKGTRGTDI